MTQAQDMKIVKEAASDAAMRSMAPDTARSAIASVQWFSSHFQEVPTLCLSEVLEVFQQAFRERLADLLEGDEYDGCGY